MAYPLPLDGVKVLDLSWVMVGPAVGRYLADYGATVIRVETTSRVETARTLAPFWEGLPGAERSGAYANWNAGKLGLTLNLALPEARQLFQRLAGWADVVIESFSPGTMRGWGLAYEDLCQIKPDLVMVSTCLNGQTGLQAEFAGYGNLSAALAGFVGLVGWPDRPPAGPAGAYTDYISPKFIAAALLAALDYWRRTGRGQYIDASQAEAALHFLSSALLDYTVNGRLPTQAGNRSDEAVPHGVYRCAGEDRWCAIAVHSESQWAALCCATENEVWLEDPRFVTLQARRQHEDALDKLLEEWTSQRRPDLVESTLQEAGVSAHAMLGTDEVFFDAQLAYRGHFVTVDHADLGAVPVEGSRFRLSRTPSRIQTAGPTLGQHNQYVLREILHLSDEEVSEIAARGALD